MQSFRDSQKTSLRGEVCPSQVKVTPAPSLCWISLSEFSMSAGTLRCHLNLSGFLYLAFLFVRESLKQRTALCCSGETEVSRKWVSVCDYPNSATSLEKSWKTLIVANSSLSTLD